MGGPTRRDLKGSRAHNRGRVLCCTPPFENLPKGWERCGKGEEIARIATLRKGGKVGRPGGTSRSRRNVGQRSEVSRAASQGGGEHARGEHEAAARSAGGVATGARGVGGASGEFSPKSETSFRTRTLSDPMPRFTFRRGALTPNVHRVRAEQAEQLAVGKILKKRNN